MGEISDALRRARQEQGARHPLPVTRSVPEPASERPAPPVDAPDVPLAHIDRTQSEGWAARAVAVPNEGAIAERFRQLAVRVEQSLAARRTQTVLIASAERQEGKTLTSCNLALALSSLGAGRRVALVDLDLRKPSVARCLGITPRTGLEIALQDGSSIEHVRVPTDFCSLDVYPVAKAQHNAHSLLSTAHFDAMVRQLTDRYSAVVFDTPPILPVPDVALIAPRLGASLMVARSGSTRRKALQDALRSLPAGHPIGVFLNGAPIPGGRDYHVYYGAEGAPEHFEAKPNG